MFQKTLILAMAAAHCAAQDPVLRGKAELVLVPVSVTDRNGRYVRDLSERDLVLYVDNVPRRIQLEDVTLPLSLAIAVQTTPASEIVLNKLRKAAGVVGPMITGYKGEAAVLTFGNYIRVAQPFTSDEDEVARAIRHLDPTGSGAGTAEAATQAVKLLAARPGNRRRVLL